MQPCAPLRFHERTTFPLDRHWTAPGVRSGNMQVACSLSTTSTGPAQRARPAAVHPRSRCQVHAAAQDGERAMAPAAPPAPALLDRVRHAALAGALSATLALAPISPAAMEAHAQTATISGDMPVLDLARVVPSEQLDSLQQQLRDLERETGWRVRMLTRFGSDGPSVEEIRAAWKTDEKTIVVFVDPSSPNILNYKFGREVRAVLRPQFFTELQGRFGNMFVVREQGESAVVMNMMDALTGCLAAGGCAVVPGLSLDHYYFTLAVSLAGGVIAGAASKLEPYGIVQRRWVWVALFAPLWGTLFVNFGLGPVVSRTADVLPLAGNIAAFAATFAATALSPKIGRSLGLSVDEQ